MDRKQNWNEWQPEDELLEKLLHDGNPSRIQSRNPLLILKKKLLHTIAWSIIITVGYICVFFFVNYWFLVTGFSMLILFNLYIIYISYKLYRSMQAHVSPEAGLLQELKRNYDGFEKWWWLQKRVAIFIYPVAVMAGYFLGGMAGAGKTMEQLMGKPVVWAGLLVCIILLVPFCIWLAKQIFNHSYGKHLEVLKENIRQLESGN